MRASLEKEYEKELIATITQKANGVGPTGAGAVAEFFPDLQDFLSASNAEFEGLINSRGNRVLSDEKIDNIVEEKEKVVKNRNISETWIFVLTRDFLENKVRHLKDMKFDDIDLNPFLTIALDLRTPREIILFNMYQSVTRSVVTSWGTLVEKLLKYSGCEKEKPKLGTKGKQPDLKKVFKGKNYYFQIKSGPNTMNVGMVESLNEIIRNIEKKGYYCLLGMTYGKRNRISSQIMDNLIDPKNKTKIGKELWDFISEIKDYHKQVIEIIGMATNKVLNKSYIELMDDKIDELEKEWLKKYAGKKLTEIFEEYL